MFSLHPARRGWGERLILSFVVCVSFLHLVIVVSVPCCRLGMNPFQKNPKHASVLAERYSVFVTCFSLFEMMILQRSLNTQ